MISKLLKQRQKHKPGYCCNPSLPQPNKSFSILGLYLFLSELIFYFITPVVPAASCLSAAFTLRYNNNGVTAVFKTILNLVVLKVCFYSGQFCYVKIIKLRDFLAQIQHTSKHILSAYIYAPFIQYHTISNRQ